VSEYQPIPERFNITAAALDRHVAEGRGNRIALHFSGRAYSYAELQLSVNACGNALRHLALGPGDHYVIRSHNRPEYLIALLAGMKIGAVPIPTNSLFRIWELEHILRNSESRVVFTSSGLADAVLEVKKNCKSLHHVIVFDEAVSSDTLSFPDFLRGASTELQPADTRASDPAFAIYTSGTTGQPKGVEHAHRWLVATGDPITRLLMCLTEDDLCFSPLEISFIYALGCNFLFPLYAGAAVAMMPGRFDPERTLAAIDSLKPTIFIAVPTIFRRLLALGDTLRKYDLSSLRMAMSSGEPLPIDTLRQAKERLGIEIYDCLGQTEIHIFMKPEPQRKLGSLGKPLPGHVVAILNEQGQEVAVGEIGHLVIRSDDPGLCLGYRGMGETWGQCHRDGWYYTKDLAYRDEDGFYWYVSRSDDLIKSRAYLISPREVESAIMEHPAVLEAGVIGTPDEQIGQRVTAFVSLKPGHHSNSNLSEEIIRLVRDKIAYFKAPKEIIFVESLPRTATGKLIRHELRARVAPSGLAPGNPSAVHKI